MADDPAFENTNEYDEAFVRTSFLLIEQGIDQNGDSAFRWRYTVDGPTALGLMQFLGDHIRSGGGAITSDDERHDE